MSQPAHRTEPEYRPAEDHMAEDRLAFAAHAQWSVNGHDLLGALLTVHRHHCDPAMRDAAGDAYDKALRLPVVRRGFELDFEQRDREAR